LTSEHKIRANRENAQASTGPKTAQGRARTARNALRHALSLSVRSDPVLSEEVEALAREIAGTDANAEIQELARRVAEAQFDLRRVRCARHQFLTRTLAEPYYDSRANMRAKLALLGSLFGKNPPEIPLDTLMTFVASTPEGPQKLAKRLNGCWPWIVTNDGRCRGASLRFGLSMRHEGGRPANASNRGTRRPAWNRRFDRADDADGADGKVRSRMLHWSHSAFLKRCCPLNRRTFIPAAGSHRLTDCSLLRTD
jgi:hypothetical protein